MLCRDGTVDPPWRRAATVLPTMPTHDADPSRPRSAPLGHPGRLQEHGGGRQVPAPFGMSVGAGDRGTIRVMTWEDSCSVARCRVLVLRQIIAGGGDLAGWQLRRALSPVLGDLLPLPSTRPGRGGQRCDARGRFVAAPPAVGSGALMPSPSPAAGGSATVDNKTDYPRPPAARLDQVHRWTHHRPTRP